MRFNLRGFFRIEAPIIIAVWFLINWYVLNILESISSRGPTERKADKNREKIYYSEFEGLDFKELLAKIKDANGQNLQIRISRENETQKERITLEYTALVFPHVIDTWKPKKIIPSRKYIFVHNQYTEQLSKNTRAFLSLCAQAGKSGRKVVIPFVRQTRFGSFHSWSPLETYYDVKYLRRLLAAAGYASLVDHQEYEKECPRNSPNHASIHFIDNSQQSMDFTKANFRLKEDFYKAIIKNTTKNGWTKCEFLDKAMKRTSGKQFCVNSDIITDWKVLEKDIVKNEKCLNIFVWRGKGGEDYRVKFSEENYQFSSIQVTFALRPGQTVLNEAERFQEALGNKYIAVHIRGEKILRSYSMQHVRLCVDLVLEVCVCLFYSFVIYVCNLSPKSA